MNNLTFLTLAAVIFSCVTALTPTEKFYDLDDDMLFQSCESNLEVLMNSYLKVPEDKVSRTKTISTTYTIVQNCTKKLGLGIKAMKSALSDNYSNKLHHNLCEMASMMLLRKLKTEITSNDRYMEDPKNPELGDFIMESLEAYKGKGCFEFEEEDEGDEEDY